jgi:hypothetical protein
MAKPEFTDTYWHNPDQSRCPDINGLSANELRQVRHFGCLVAVGAKQVPRFRYNVDLEVFLARHQERIPGTY